MSQTDRQTDRQTTYQSMNALCGDYAFATAGVLAISTERIE